MARLEGGQVSYERGYGRTAALKDWPGKIILLLAFFLLGLVCPPAPTAYDTGDKSYSALVYPTRIDLLPGNRFVTTDYTNGFVYIYGADRRELRRFAVRGAPLAVAWGRGKLFVGNESTARIEVYSLQGRMLGHFEEHVESPRDMAFDTFGKLLYVVDGGEKAVKVFHPDGRLLNAFGAGQLLNPTALALDTGRGHIAVSDYGDPASKVQASIKVFGTDGALLFSIGSGEMPSAYRFSRPQGLAINQETGHLLMLDGMTGKLLVIDKNSKLVLKALGGFGTAEGQLMLPLDIAMDPGTLDLYVTSYGNNRVEFFREGGKVP